MWNSIPSSYTSNQPDSPSVPIIVSIYACEAEAVAGRCTRFYLLVKVFFAGVMRSFLRQFSGMGFRHDVLPDRSTYIRLLKLLHVDTETGLISLSLTSYRVPKTTPMNFESYQYIALSYKWGAPEIERNILINWQKYRIRQNLHEFLTHLTRPANSWTLSAPDRPRNHD
jgi:hypothetical protein